MCNFHHTFQVWRRGLEKQSVFRTEVNTGCALNTLGFINPDYFLFLMKFKGTHIASIHAATTPYAAFFNYLNRHYDDLL
jgi:hypothetical protein